MGSYKSGVFYVIPPDTLFFITITVIDWIDVFTREDYKRIIIESLDYCRRNKGLNLHAYVLMTNHIHLMVSHPDGKDAIARIIGDFKKYTSKRVVDEIIANPIESRKRWLLHHFDEEVIIANDDASCSISKINHGLRGNTGQQTHFTVPSTSKNNNRKSRHLWQRGYDVYCITNIKHLRQKLDYLHDNPVRAGIVAKPWHYIYSSCTNYCDKPSLIEIDFLDLGIDSPSSRGTSY